MHWEVAMNMSLKISLFNGRVVYIIEITLIKLETVWQNGLIFISQSNNDPIVSVTHILEIDKNNF